MQDTEEFVANINYAETAYYLQSKLLCKRCLRICRHCAQEPHSPAIPKKRKLTKLGIFIWTEFFRTLKIKINLLFGQTFLFGQKK